MATLEEQSTAEVARMARPHSVTMPGEKRVDFATYQETWLHRNAAAWQRGLNPLEIPIYDSDGIVADLTLEEAIQAKFGGVFKNMIVLGG